MFSRVGVFPSSLGAGDTYSDPLDTDGYQSAIVDLVVGDVGVGATADVSVEESAADDPGGTWGAVADASFAKIYDDAVNTNLLGEVVLSPARKRFVRVKLSVTGGSAQLSVKVWLMGPRDVLDLPLVFRVVE